MASKIPDYKFKIGKIIYQENKIPSSLPTYSSVLRFKKDGYNFIVCLLPLFEYYPCIEEDYPDQIDQYLSSVHDFYSQGKYKEGYRKERKRLKECSDVKLI